MATYKVHHSVNHGSTIDIHIDIETASAVVDADGKEITPATYRREVVTVDASKPETWDAQMEAAAV